jgi:cytochrome c-type biogenesis protein CcmH/NrfF
MGFIRVLIPFAVLAFMVYSIVDVIVTDERRIRALNKVLWVLLIIILPVIGGVLWFLLGKERNDPGAEPRRMAPDDDPNFLKNLRRDEEQDERIRRLEQELAELDDDPPKD